MAADDLRNSFSLQKLVTMELPSMELAHSVPADDIVKSVKMCIIHRVTSLIIPQYTRAISQLTAVKRRGPLAGISLHGRNSCIQCMTYRVVLFIVRT